MEKTPCLYPYETKKNGTQFRFVPTPSMKKRGFVASKLGGDIETAKAACILYRNEFREMQEAEQRDAIPTQGNTVSSVIKNYERDPTFYTDKGKRTREEIDFVFRILNAEFGADLIETLSRGVVKSYYRDLLEIHSVHKTARVMKYFSSLFTFAVDEEIILANPMSKMKIKKPAGRDQQWTPDQVKAVIECALTGFDYTPKGSFMPRFQEPRPSVALAVAIAFDAPVPQQDLLALTGANFDGEGFDLTQIKQRAENTVYAALSPWVLELIARYVDMENKAPIILNETLGARYTDKDNFGKQFRKFQRAAGVSGVTFHDLRRTAMSAMGNSGATNVEISACSGLRPYSPTLKTYIKPNQDAAKSAQKKRAMKQPALVFAIAAD